MKSSWPRAQSTACSRHGLCYQMVFPSAVLPVCSLLKQAGALYRSSYIHQSLLQMQQPHAGLETYSLTTREPHSAHPDNAHPDKQTADWLHYSTTPFGVACKIVVCLQIQMLQTPNSVVDVDQHSICLCIFRHCLASAWKVGLAMSAVSAYGCCIRLAGLLEGQQQRCGSAESSAGIAQHSIGESRQQPKVSVANIQQRISYLTCLYSSHLMRPLVLGLDHKRRHQRCLMVLVLHPYALKAVLSRKAET